MQNVDEESKGPDLRSKKKSTGLEFTTDEKALFQDVTPLALQKCTDVAAKKVDYDPQTADDTIEIHNHTVLQVLRSFVELQKKIVNLKTIQSAFSKLQTWLNSFEGDDVEAAVNHITASTVELLEDDSNNVEEFNVLIFRHIY